MDLKLALKALPFIAIALLLGLVLWQRNSLTDKSAKLDAATARIADVTDANKSLKTAIDGFAKQRVDNDAIAEAVAKRVGSNGVRETHTETIIREAKANDPQVRNWADTPVPSSVRDALRAH